MARRHHGHHSIHNFAECLISWNWDRFRFRRRQSVGKLPRSNNIHALLPNTGQASGGGIGAPCTCGDEILRGSKGFS